MLRAGGFRSSRFSKGVSRETLPGRCPKVSEQATIRGYVCCTKGEMEVLHTGHYSLESLSLVNFLIILYVKIIFVVFGVHIFILTL